MSNEEEWITKHAGDPRSNDDLIKALMADPYSGEVDEAFTILQARRDPGIIRRAIDMSRRPDPIERYIGAGILSQNGAGRHKIMREESVEALLDRVLTDDDPDVLVVSASGLHDYEDERISPSVARLASHPDADVRHAVVMGLLTREDEVAINTLIVLSQDPDAHVRNWATFGLAQQIDADTPEIREALYRRVDDDESEVRAESLLGLARRDDERVVDALIRELRAIAEADGFWEMVFEAAAKVGDSRLCPELAVLQEDGFESESLDEAIASCRLPRLDEMEDEPDGAESTCPVCGLKNAFPEPGWDFCRRCGWHNDPRQRAEPDAADGWNRRSLSQERARWQRRKDEAVLGRK